MQQSTVKWFDAKKGYGFLEHPGGGEDVFVHYSQIVSTKDFKTLRTGQQVEFGLEDGPKGLHALDVRPLEEAGEGTKKADREDGTPGEAQAVQEPSSNGDAAQEASADNGEDDEWTWNEEDWTDEHGNPPDPMASPSF